MCSSYFLFPSVINPAQRHRVSELSLQIQHRIYRFPVLRHRKIHVAALCTVVFCRFTHVTEYRTGFQHIALFCLKFLEAAVRQLIAVSDIQDERRTRLLIDLRRFHDSFRRREYLISGIAADYERRIVFILVQRRKIDASVHAVIDQNCACHRPEQRCSLRLVGNAVVDQYLLGDDV